MISVFRVYCFTNEIHMFFVFCFLRFRFLSQSLLTLFSKQKKKRYKLFCNWVDIFFQISVWFIDMTSKVKTTKTNEMISNWPPFPFQIKNAFLSVCWPKLNVFHSNIFRSIFSLANAIKSHGNITVDQLKRKCSNKIHLSEWNVKTFLNPEEFFSRNSLH